MAALRVENQEGRKVYEHHEDLEPHFAGSVSDLPYLEQNKAGKAIASFANLLKLHGPLVITEGPWALFRMFDRFEVEPSSVPERFSVVMNLDGKRARMEVIAASVFNPFQLREVKQFRCPAAL